VVAASGAPEIAAAGLRGLDGRGREGERMGLGPPDQGRRAGAAGQAAAVRYLTVGAAGEAAAARYLMARGLRLLAQDWRCRMGQLDLVCEDGGVLVAVEVKARRGRRFGLAQEAVNGRKRAKLRSLLEAYRLAERRGGQPCRIDVVAVQFTRDLGIVSCEHIRNAVSG